MTISMMMMMMMMMMMRLAESSSSSGKGDGCNKVGMVNSCVAADFDCWRKEVFSLEHNSVMHMIEAHIRSWDEKNSSGSSPDGGSAVRLLAYPEAYVNMCARRSGGVGSGKGEWAAKKGVPYPVRPTPPYHHHHHATYPQNHHHHHHHHFHPSHNLHEPTGPPYPATMTTTTMGMGAAMHAAPYDDWAARKAARIGGTVASQHSHWRRQLAVYPWMHGA